MGTITQRKRADGSAAYTAQIRIKNGGIITHSEAQTFDRRALATEWLRRRETELQQQRASGAVPHKPVTLGEILDSYASGTKTLASWGRTKTAHVKQLRASGLAGKDATTLTVQDVVEHIKHRRIIEGAGPATALNDVTWLRQALLHARAETGLAHPVEVLDAAKYELTRQRMIQKARSRTRRLAAGEEEKLLRHFAERDGRSDVQMVPIMRFALATARRQEEITKLLWIDVDFDKGIAWLDDVKHPRMKTGNRRAFRLLTDAAAIIQSMPRTHAQVFPFKSRSIGAAFTRACSFLGIEGLRFHDLRHEATSRLFERGYSIQEVSQFTLHESWQTLRRYTHLHPENVPER